MEEKAPLRRSHDWENKKIKRTGRIVIVVSNIKRQVANSKPMSPDWNRLRDQKEPAKISGNSAVKSSGKIEHKGMTRPTEKALGMCRSWPEWRPTATLKEIVDVVRVVKVRQLPWNQVEQKKSNREAALLRIKEEGESEAAGPENVGTGDYNQLDRQMNYSGMRRGSSQNVQEIVNSRS